MAITFVNKGTWAAGTTSISPGIPASMQDGDLMILTVHTCNQAISAITGWTEVTSSPVSTGTANTAGGTRIGTYYRWWQSGDGAPSVAVTSGTVTNGIIHGYRGVHPTTPFDATPVATTLATASTTLTMTGITTATANACIVWSIARDQDLNSTTAVTAFTNANLTGITEVHDQVVNTGVGGGIWCGYGFKATAGATGNTTITQTSSIAVGLTIALRPAPNNYPLTCNSGSYTYTGSSVTVNENKSLSVSAGSYTYTGSSVDITKGAALNNRSLTANAGSYTYTGSSATLSRGRTLTASSGSYTYSGINSQISRNRAITGSAGSYTYSGSSISITKGAAATNYTLTAQAGAYTYSGSSANLSRGRPLTASAGSYTYTGSSATVKRDRALTASSGSYTYNGSSLSVNRNRYLTSNAGSYTYTGNTVTVVRGRSLASQSGSYAYTGSSATLEIKGNGAYSLSCLSGSYVLTGSDISITKSSEVVANTGGPGRRKRIYLERDGKILLFNNASQAAAYVEAEKARETPQEAPEKRASRGLQPVKKLKVIPKPQVIEINVIAELIRHFRMANDLTQMIQKEEFEALIALQRKLLEMQDEEDVELLLLAA